MNPAQDRSAERTPVAGLLARLADFAYRRRGRMVLAWVVALVLTIGIAPRLAGDFSAEFATAGSESQAAADLVAERGTSGDTIEVVWRADAGAGDRPVLARVERFLERAEGLEGVASAQPARVSRDGTIALTRLELDRRDESGQLGALPPDRDLSCAEWPTWPPPTAAVQGRPGCALMSDSAVIVGTVTNLVVPSVMLISAAIVASLSGRRRL
jgi:hypothetical protein